MMANLAQRRAAKALRRKAVVQAKRQAGTPSERQVMPWNDGTAAPKPPSYKASAALLDVAELLINETDDLHIFHKKLLTAMFAWNLSLFPIEARNAAIPKFFGSLVQGLDEDDVDISPLDRDQFYSSFERTVTELINRKMILYPLDRRRLVDVEVVETSTGFRTNVKSEFDLAA